MHNMLCSSYPVEYKLLYTGHGEFTIVGAGIKGMQQSLLLWPLSQYKFPHGVWMYAFKCMASSYSYSILAKSN